MNKLVQCPVVFHWNLKDITMHLYLFMASVQASCYHQVFALQVWSSFMQHQVSPAKQDLILFLSVYCGIYFHKFQMEIFFP